ncbi:MAG TPA: shikimate dehydrogenase [Candidatus Acidoferrales bacterium]|nr:shikimate dehydrogenase [Candidatus Acidoferrales bacterium]
MAKTHATWPPWNFARLENQDLKVFTGKNRLCAVVAATDAGAMGRQLHAALAQIGARTKTMELRLDWLKDDAEIDRFLRTLAATKPRANLIATCRRVAAGGKYRGSIAKQLLHLAEALRAGCSWYDLEIESIRECPPEVREVLLGEGKCLASAHFFDRLPRDLDRTVRELETTRPEAIKIAAQCDSLADGVRVLRLARGKGTVVAVPMGVAALALRILALREGSALSYAPVENSTAPGQISLDEIENVYRGSQFDRRTRVYGTIGNPIAHSLSPVMHNAAFLARRINAVHLPFLVKRLPDFLGAIKPLGIFGFGITLPHKQAIMRYLDDCDPVAAEIGAVNTVVIRGGKLHGYNTDCIGVLRALGHRMRLRGSRILIVGAGGAARGAAFALARAGSRVFIGARRKRRAEELAKAVRGEAVRLNDLRRMSFDAIVNATPVGMHPSVQESPLESRDLNCRLVFDMIYRPRMTRLLRLAARRGIGTVSGIEMFVAQGIAQWEIWTGRRAPANVMHRAAIDALEGRVRPASGI